MSVSVRRLRAAVVETRRGSHRPLIKRYQATTEGSESASPWNVPGYSGFVPHKQFTMAETHGGSMASAESGNPSGTAAHEV